MARSDFIVPVTYFTPVTCFLTFNLTAVLGNMLPSQRFAFVSFGNFTSMYSSSSVKKSLYFAAKSSLSNHSCHPSFPFHSFLRFVQLQTQRGGKTLASFISLGLGLLDWRSPLRIHLRLPFISSDDVLLSMC